MDNKMAANNVNITSKGFLQFGSQEGTRSLRTDVVIQQE